MITTAWQWAAQNGKLKKNEVNGGEYAELNVDQVRWDTKEKAQSMVTTASAQVQDCQYFADLCFLHQYASFCMNPLLWEDTSGSIADPIDEAEAPESVSPAAPTGPAVQPLPQFAGIKRQQKIMQSCMMRA